jgi:hypothetical protein
VRRKQLSSLHRLSPAIQNCWAHGSFDKLYPEGKFREAAGVVGEQGDGGDGE